MNPTSMPRPDRPWISWSVAAVGALAPALILALAAYLALGAQEAWRHVAFGDLFSDRWLPLAGAFGLNPLVAGTLASTFLALCGAVPVGLGAALYLSLYARAPWRTVLDGSVALLGAMPSVILGLWGLTWIVPRSGSSLASASLVLTLMILPTFTLLTGAALRQVPADLVEALRALGVGETVVALRILAHARLGILGAGVLATTRGLGEAVALSMVAGNVGMWPTLDGPVATLTTTLIVEFDGATGLHRSSLHLAALLVMVLIAGVSVVGRALHSRGSHGPRPGGR